MSDRMVLPIDHIVVNGLQIPGTLLAWDGAEYDVATGEMTVKFVNVSRVEVVYKHALQKEGIREHA